jgi:tetratricopeptide (TPR) repeat protein
MRDSTRRLLFLLPAMALVAGCAGRRPPVVEVPPPTPIPLVDVAALIQRGCYRCLEDAHAAAVKQGQTNLAFEAALLLVLRSKELGLPVTPWLERANAATENDPLRIAYERMAAAVPADALSGDREAFIGRPREFIDPQTRRTKLETLADGSASRELRAYVQGALVCAFSTAEDIDAFVKSIEETAAPLLHYRAGLCLAEHASRLRRLQESEGGFVDADYPLGRYARDDAAPDQEEAMRRFQSASAAFPASSSIPTAIGNLYRAWEEWAPASTAYESALALRPTHPDALLGRTIALSHLGRHQESLDTVARLIEVGRWFQGEAYYWRGWNHLQLKDYPAARTATDRAKSLMVNASVFVLSGMIDWSMMRLDTAEREFEQALTMDFGQCDAALFLGGVRAEMAKAEPALAAFNQARQCYDLSIAVRRKLIEAVLAGKGSEPTKARQVASQERAIAASESRRADATRAAAQVQAHLDARKPPPAPPPTPSRAPRR